LLYNNLYLNICGYWAKEKKIKDEPEFDIKIFLNCSIYNLKKYKKSQK
jgi:hypothetical protein